MAIGNDQFAQFAFKATTYKWMRREIVGRGLDRGHGTLCGSGILVAQELKGAVDMIQRPL